MPGDDANMEDSGMSVEKERRAGGPRVPLHTLVEIGAGEGGSAAFEAEAVDVTTAGMHLKTAYLPEIGEPLICRFEGGGTEVIVQGEVAWRTEDSYGGDFGVRFLEMDQESLDALRGISGDLVDEPNADDPGQTDTAQVVRGTRVRLHIEGLGSPMKARVREGTQSEVMVGSNLEFLRVGRTIDLENVDGEVNRPARIERISVEVEPTSHVPQLIVALRYLDIPEEDPAPLKTQYADDDVDETSQDEAYHAEGAGDDAYEDEDDGEDGEDKGGGSAVWDKFKKVGPKFAVVGSAARVWGGKAAEAVGGAVSAAKKKAAEKVRERQESKAPRRTTAPPPKGALRGDGTRKGTVKETQEPVEPTEAQTKKAFPKRIAAIALVAVLLSIVGIGFARGAFLSSDEDEVASAEGVSVDVAALPAAEGDDPGDPPIVPGAMGTDTSAGAGAGLVANVPLFGPTPMTTAAPMAPMAAIAVPAVAAVTPPPGDVGSAEAEAEPEEGDDSSADMVASNDEGSDDADEAEETKPSAKADSKKKGSAKTASNTSFGRGRVDNPVVLNLKMNRNIKDIRGVAQSDGFAIDVVGARSAEPAAGLRRQDSRIASSRVVNKGSNAQLTIRFKGAVPNYRVQANGSTLRILIDGDKKTAAAKPASRGKKPR
jgi:hypothetical protein